MGDTYEAQGTVESTAENTTPQYSYVVHGAEAYCPCGSRPGRLTIPTCHGTYMHDMPIMTVYDSKEDTNIKCFGFCSSISNPDRLTEVEKVMDKVEKSKNLLDGIMDGLSFLGNAIASAFGFGDEPDPNDPYHGYGEDVYKSVLVCCEPMFATMRKWDGGTDRLRINGANALNSNCTIVCLKDAENGIIHIMNDGQENAAMEQAGAADMASWKPGDSYPQPTQGNMEALEASIADLEEQMKNENNPYKKAELQAEIDAKQQLHDEMKSTLKMLSEMQLQAADLNSQKYAIDAQGKEAGYLTQDQAKEYSEYNSAYQQTMQDMQAIKDAFMNGTPVSAVGEEQFNKDLNKACEVRSNESDLNTYLANNASDEKNIYCNGKLMSQSEYNQYTVDYANEVMPEVERDWLTGEIKNS